MDKPIALVGAMEEEIVHIKRHMNLDKAEDTKKPTPRFYQGSFMGKDVVLLCSGVGKEKAQKAANILTEEYPLRAIISIGCAGAIHSDIRIGDVVVASQLFSDVPEEEGPFPSHQGLIEKIERCCQLVGGKYFIGNMLTSTDVVSSSQAKRDIYERYQALAVEMESAFFAKEAFKKNIPFLAVRSISDTADESIHLDYEKFLDDEDRLIPHKAFLYFLKAPWLLFKYYKIMQNLRYSIQVLNPLIESLVKGFSEFDISQKAEYNNHKTVRRRGDEKEHF